MTQDEIIRMAREAGFSQPWTAPKETQERLARFAALVAAHEREKQAEQEHVCKRCSGLGIVPIGDGYSVDPCPDCATPVEPVKQEPVAWVTAKESFCGFPKLVFSETQKDGYKPLYAAPVRTKDLTDDEVAKAYMECTGGDIITRCRAVIAADRELNK